MSKLEIIEQKENKELKQIISDLTEILTRISVNEWMYINPDNEEFIARFLAFFKYKKDQIINDIFDKSRAMRFDKE